MSTSRRDFVKITGAATAGAVLGAPVAGFASDPALGLIFPPKDYPIPPDAKRLYPAGVEFLGDALKKRGAKVISFFGSSLTFYKGAKFNQDLVERVTKATGVPATTQSNGLIDGLRTANAKRVAVATAYTDVVTGRLKLFLEEHGFEVTSAKGLGYERVPEGAATQEILFNLGADAYANSGKADALVVSCGALRTLDLIVPLENRIKVPVVSSTPHGLMNGVRLLGVNPRAQGFGMIFSRA